MRSFPIIAAGLALLALPALAETALAEQGPDISLEPPASATRDEGLVAWERINEVVSHPRCANCHVAEDGIPMWSGPSFGATPRPHGMNVQAGNSRMGVETLVCSTCHAQSSLPNTRAHAAPHVGLAWQLPPAEFAWFDRTSAEICAQLSDPERTGGRDWMGLAEHLVTDAGHQGFVLWGWDPGGTREPAPYSLEAHVADMLIWGVAGTPCPEEN